jgi:hypothetical protein
MELFHAFEMVGIYKNESRVRGSGVVWKFDV